MDTLRQHVDLWYPNIEIADRKADQATEIEVALIHVRAANSLVVDYDFERDGYRLRMALADDGEDERLVEVGFVSGWAAR